MGRRATQTVPHYRTVAFSTRHLRKDHRDKLRVYGEVLNLNMEESVDLALCLGLPLLEKRAMGVEDEDDKD